MKGEWDRFFIPHLAFPFQECMNGMNPHSTAPGPPPAISFSTGGHAVKMTYDGEGEPLMMIMEEDGVVFKCSIRTQTPDTVREMLWPFATLMEERGKARTNT